MKKILLLFAIIVSGTLQAQTFNFSCGSGNSTDTVITPDGWEEDTASAISFYENECGDSVYTDDNGMWLVELGGHVLNTPFTDLTAALAHADANNTCPTTGDNERITVRLVEGLVYVRSDTGETVSLISKQGGSQLQFPDPSHSHPAAAWIIFPPSGQPGTPGYQWVLIHNQNYGGSQLTFNTAERAIEYIINL